MIRPHPPMPIALIPTTCPVLCAPRRGRYAFVFPNLALNRYGDWLDTVTYSVTAAPLPARNGRR